MGGPFRLRQRELYAVPWPFPVYNPHVGELVNEALAASLRQIASEGVVKWLIFNGILPRNKRTFSITIH